MAGITGQGDTFDLPNYVGDLFEITPTDTPFLSAIGGLTGGEAADATLFQWQGFDLRDAADDRQRLEGADAPTAEQRVRFNVNNVVEVHQEAVELSYTKLGAVGLGGSNPVMNELGWQVDQQLKQIARDVEKSFLTGAFSNPATNATARKTRGIMAATATNVSTQGTLIGTAVIEADDETFTIAAHGLTAGDQVTLTTLTGGAIGIVKVDTTYYVVTVTTNTFKVALRAGGTAIAFATDGGAVVYEATPLTEAIVLEEMQEVWENGGIQESDTATLMCGALLKRGLTKIFITSKGFQESSRTVGGVHVMTIETDFGTINVMLNRHMPTSALQIVSLEECSPVFLPIPGKGFLFVEELAKTGAAEKRQIYGEIGLKYGNERKHGKILRVGSPA
jgi:hypothetical protein